MTTTDQETGVAIYNRFLRAFNAADYQEIDEVIGAGFVDHHPGFKVHDLASYKAALRGAHEALRITAELEEAFGAGDKVVVRCRLTGEHVGTIMGIPPTGRKVSWETTEIWRVEDGKLVERWAQDDLLGLREQISPDAENVALIRRLNDVVNERRYDDMDELFHPAFTDRNPAWSVKSLEELKDIIRSAKEGLEFLSHQDLIYPAEDGKVVIHLTFTGRHVKPFMGQQPTGREVKWTSIEVYRIEENKIVERWVQADTAGLMRQIGVPLP
jgi:predicted ester cyclase